MTFVPTGVFGTQTLLCGATGEIRDRVLGEIAAGKLRTSFALTEPEAGSDAAAIRTQAVRDGDEWVINGSKIFATGAHVADYVVLTARTGSLESRHAGVTAFLVDASSTGRSPGFQSWDTTL